MIKVIYGPMFSGKTSELLRHIRDDSNSDKKTKLFKPLIDKRYSKVAVVTHDGKVQRAHRIDVTKEGLEKMRNIIYNDEPDIVGIDEAQFFPPEMVDMLREFSPYTDIIAAGLDMDFAGNKFETTDNLIKIADETKQLKSVCAVCGKEATMTQRIANVSAFNKDEHRVLVGGSEYYEPRCENCHIATLVLR